MSAEKDRSPGFYIDHDYKAVILEGQYDSLRALSQYHRGKQHDRVSYFGMILLIISASMLWEVLYYVKISTHCQI